MWQQKNCFRKSWWWIMSPFQTIIQQTFVERITKKSQKGDTNNNIQGNLIFPKTQANSIQLTLTLNLFTNTWHFPLYMTFIQI